MIRFPRYINKGSIFKALLIFILVFSLFLFTAFVEFQREVEKKKQNLKDELLITQTNIENTITSRISKLYGLVTYIKINSYFDQDQYERFVYDVYRSRDDLVQRIFYLTDTTVTHIFPYEQYKEVIGKDLSLIQSQKDLVMYGKNNLRTVFAAPVNLVEGGDGIIVRIPVDIDGDYVGQLSIVFDYEKTLSASGVYDKGLENFISLSSVDPLTGNMYCVWSNDQNGYLDLNKVEIDFNIYDTPVFLRAISKNGFSGNSNLFYIILSTGWVISFFLAFTSYKFFETNSKLKYSKLKLQKTQTKLIDSNQALTTTVNKLLLSEQELEAKYEEIKANEEHILFLAEKDFLTGLKNRMKFSQDLEYRLKNNLSGVILLIDIDNFKDINDTIGHIYGDKVLIHIGELIKKALLENSEAYRIGGDEFIVHMEDAVNEDIINLFISKLLEYFKKYNAIDDINNYITASIGISRYPQDGSTVNELVMKSDIAMYEAKRAGKNRYCYFSIDMTDKIDEKMNVISILRKSIEEDQFKLLYQPIYDSVSKKASSFEALIRIKDSSLSPGVFIDIAEETGLIVPIGRWVLQEVFKQLQFWQDRNFDLIPVAINISPRQIRDDNLFDFIKFLLEEYEICPSLIELEITENMLLEDKDDNLKKLNKIKSLGICISLDDFGTGYSSLSYLSYMPIDKIKLDKSIKDKFLDRKDTEVIKSLISMFHGLNLKVVAEGVETEEEYIQLLSHSTDYIQGYLFSKPLNPEDAALILKTNQ
ncbi:diguanylate cyclase (GGDEF)-like protein [Acetoanaerobium pronyense]|uniref:Diguanylate cyclase (GGDEF)-like protein n=1 Tax=Acetoanaerobium pronyense TaxID=1482736 RepID=A0ABS4KK06_9FIRM|nr:EAL domain-containing protein [Acetoanaerobium pronyense]MBP2028128.1 diguanylate cyclase (GGDEF)-like protein [Acetoanaerobium pronyense]